MQNIEQRTIPLSVGIRFDGTTDNETLIKSSLLQHKNELTKVIFENCIMTTEIKKTLLECKKLQKVKLINVEFTNTRIQITRLWNSLMDISLKEVLSGTISPFFHGLTTQNTPPSINPDGFACFTNGKHFVTVNLINYKVSIQSNIPSLTELAGGECKEIDNLAIVKSVQSENKIILETVNLKTNTTLFQMTPNRPIWDMQINSYTKDSQKWAYALAYGLISEQKNKAVLYILPFEKEGKCIEIEFPLFCKPIAGSGTCCSALINETTLAVILKKESWSPPKTTIFYIDLTKGEIIQKLKIPNEIRNDYLTFRPSGFASRPNAPYAFAISYYDRRISLINKNNETIKTIDLGQDISLPKTFGAITFINDNVLAIFAGNLDDKNDRYRIVFYNFNNNEILSQYPLNIKTIKYDHFPNVEIKLLENGQLAVTATKQKIVRNGFKHTHIYVLDVPKEEQDIIL